MKYFLHAAEKKKIIALRFHQINRFLANTLINQEKNPL